MGLHVPRRSHITARCEAVTEHQINSIFFSVKELTMR